MNKGGYKGKIMSNTSIATPSMTIIHCRFCQKEFKSLILDKQAASLDITQRFSTHMNERHPEEAKKYMNRLQILIGPIPYLLMFTSLAEISSESVFMLEQFEMAKKLLFEFFPNDEWEKIDLQAQTVSTAQRVIQ